MKVPGLHVRIKVDVDKGDPGNSQFLDRQVYKVTSIFTEQISRVSTERKRYVT